MKKWCFLIVLIAVSLLTMVGIRMGTIIEYNNHDHPLLFTDREFDKAVSIGPYAKGVPMEDMDMSIVRMWIRESDMMDPVWTHIVTLEEPMRYYTAVDAEECVLELPAGTEVVLCSNQQLLYGIYTLPTYTQGWRYAKPVIQWGDQSEAEVYKEIETLEMYYVRTRDIFHLCETFFDQILPEDPSITALYRTAPQDHLLQYDAELYNLNAYLSPDLTYPVLDRANVWLLIAAGACIVTGAGLILWEKKRQK